MHVGSDGATRRPCCKERRCIHAINYMFPCRASGDGSARRRRPPPMRCRRRWWSRRSAKAWCGRCRSPARGLSQDWGPKRSWALSAVVFGEQGCFVLDTGQRRPHCRVNQTWIERSPRASKCLKLFRPPILRQSPRRLGPAKAVSRQERCSERELGKNNSRGSGLRSDQRSYGSPGLNRSKPLCRGTRSIHMNFGPAVPGVTQGRSEHPHPRQVGARPPAGRGSRTRLRTS